jgi:hypothetical protein
MEMDFTIHLPKKNEANGGQTAGSSPQGGLQLA